MAESSFLALREMVKLPSLVRAFSIPSIRAAAGLDSQVTTADCPVVAQARRACVDERVGEGGRAGSAPRVGCRRMGDTRTGSKLRRSARADPDK